MAPSLLPIPVSAVGREVHLEVAGVLPRRKGLTRYVRYCA